MVSLALPWFSGNQEHDYQVDQVDQVDPPKTVPVLPTVEWIRMVTASSCITVKTVTTVLCRCYCCAGGRRTPERKVSM